MDSIIIDAYTKDGNMHEYDIEYASAVELSAINASNLEYEAVKALAVLKRSELSRRIKNSIYYDERNERLIIDEDSFLNLDDETKNILKKAAKDTKGIIAVSNERAVSMYFTECCGGGTANSEDVLGYKINYLRKVLCKYCSANFTEKKLSASEIAGRVNYMGNIYKNEIHNTLHDVLRDDTGRIISLEVYGRKLSGSEFMKDFDFASNKVYFAENEISFKVVGRGCGLGICLEGACNLSKSGCDCFDIIKYYYTGVEFKILDESSIINLLSDKTIIIDPGHGGLDDGNVKNGIREKDANLSISLYLLEKLRNIKANVILTRDDDTNVLLGERVRLINKIRPDFYVSIHQNVFASENVNGFEIYCYERDSEAIKLSEVVNKLISKVGIKSRGIKTGNYYLLRECKVSGIIIECMYVSGNEDRNKYNDETYKKIANAIYEGICRYYNIVPQD